MLGQFTQFPGFDGIPYRTRTGVAPNIKMSDPEHLQPALTTDMHVRVFDMAKEEDRLDLENILTKCAKGLAYESRREQNYDQNSGTYKVFLIWGEHFYEDPREARDGTREYK